MTGLDKRTAIVVSASTVIGFFGDVLTYSLAASKSEGKRFSVHFPTGRSLFNLVWLGIVTGLIIDYAIKKIEVSQMAPEEIKLNALVDNEKVKIKEGIVKDKTPEAVVWA